MDLVTLITLGLPVGGAIAAGAWWVIQKALGAFSQLKDHDRRLGGLDEELTEVKATQEQHDDRLKKTEEVAHSVDRLADAVKHMGEIFAGQLGSLADKMKIHNDNNNQRFDELNDRLGEKRTFRQSDK
jgi:hypothetical protein